MLDVLIASGTHLELRPAWLTSSLIAHGLVLTLAAVATRAALDSPPAVVADPAILLFVPKPQPVLPPEVRREPTAPGIVIAEPPPKGFQTVAALQDIPKLIPPVDLTQRPLDPRDFTGRGVEGGIAEGVIGGTGKVDDWSPAGGLDAIYEATTPDERFVQATLVSQPTPRYPTVLAVAGIEGRVALEFVIDTTGRVEPVSIRILESNHDAFEAAARASLTRAIFRPARMRGRPVRQLTRQAVRFVAPH